MLVRAHASLSIAAALAGGCYAFPDVQPGECGNRVLEADEDCDSDDRTCDAQCRITCEPLAKTSNCPPDKLCGFDEICRAPAGTFATATRIDRPGARWIAAGDLDGNHHADLVVQLGEHDIDAIHLDDAGLATVHLADAFGRAAIGDLTGDGRDEVFVTHHATTPEGSGIALLGEVGAERAAFAATFATLTTTGAAARLLSVTPGRDRVLELVSPTETHRWVSGAAAALTVDEPIAIDPSTLGLAVAHADLDGAGTCAAGTDTPAFPRREVALASAGAEVVRIASTCGGTDPMELDWLGDVALPSGKLGSAGSFFCDVNADARLDLVAQTDAGDVLVAYGVGDGTFHGAPEVPTEDGDGTFAALPLWSSADAEDQLFAAEDLDGDGTVELVTAKHWVVDPLACAGDCPHAWADVLDAAATLDINDDGTLDVVGIHGETAVLHLRDVGGQDPFKPHDVDLAGPGSGLAVGDFDRDTIRDVAFVEIDDETPSPAAQHVAVLYGRPVPPWQLARFGPFFAVETLTVERDDTIVARTKDGELRPAGAFIRTDMPIQEVGFAVREPVLVRTPDGLVAAAIVLRPDEDVERLASFGFRDGTLSPHDVAFGPVLEDMAPGTGDTALAAAIDLVREPAGVDELVVLGSTAQGGHVWVAQLEPASGTWEIIDTFSIASGRFARRPLAIEPPMPVGGPGSTLAIGDYDGDGDLDVLATLDKTLPVVVVFANHDGALDHAPLVPFNEKTSFEYAHVVPWHVGASGRHRWLVGGSEGIGVIEIDTEDEHIEFHDVESTSASAIAAADVDADGLLDFVLATERDVRVHLALESVGAP